MSNGIIQQVITAWRNDLRKRFIINDELSLEIDKLQQELIEKIREQISENYINGFDRGNLKRFSGRKDIVLSKPEVLEKLIGDSKE